MAPPSYSGGFLRKRYTNNSNNTYSNDNGEDNTATISTTTNDTNNISPTNNTYTHTHSHTHSRNLIGGKSSHYNIPRKKKVLPISMSISMPISNPCRKRKRKRALLPTPFIVGIIRRLLLYISVSIGTSLVLLLLLQYIFLRHNMNILNLNSIIMNLNLNINFQQHMHIMKQILVPYMARHIPLLNRYECRRLQQIRTEDGIPLDPSIDSVFNCHSVYGRCQYYRPAHFFHPTCSSISSMGRDVNVNVNTNENENANANDGTPNIISSSATDGSRTRNMKPKQKKPKRNEKVVLQTFQTHLQQMIQLRTNRELWVGQPPIIMPYVSFPNPSDGVILKHEKEKHNAKNTNDNADNVDNTSTNADNVDNTNTNENVNDARRGKRNLSFIHIHKTGGTTMVTAMRDLIVIDDTHTDTHTDTGDGNATDSIVGIEGRKKSTNTNTGAKSNSNANANTDTNMDSNNNKNGSNQYTGSFNIYTQFRTRRRSKRAWKDADRFIDRAVRYQREDKWDDIHEIEIEEDDSNDDNNGRQDVLDDVISVETTRTDTTITTTTTTTTVDMNHMIFALVRDPAERFISAVGQVTSSKFASKGRAKQFKDLCIPPSYEHQEEGEHENEHGNEHENEHKNEDGREHEHEHEQMEQHHDEIKTSDVLRCYVNIVKNRGYWVDVHFTPMILELSFSTMQKDVPVAIFPFEELPNVLLEIGFNPTIKKKDGSKNGYRSNVMYNATLDDFDEDVFMDLCELYLMDVLFMRDLGYETSCDSFV